MTAIDWHMQIVAVKQPKTYANNWANQFKFMANIFDSPDLPCPALPLCQAAVAA